MNQLKDITELTLKAGAIVAESAGETYRVEETMHHLACALGADEAIPYATPTGLFLSCQMNSAPQVALTIVTRMERIKNRSTNLGKIAAINSLSREIALQKTVDLRRVKRQIQAINDDKGYSATITTIATALNAFVFALLFSGTIQDALLAFAVSVIMKIVLYSLSPLNLSCFIFTIIGSTIISFFTALLSQFGIVMSFDIVNIAALMALVPGVAIVIAIRDIIAGDYVSGGGRVTEAFVSALGISLGAATGLVLFPSSMAYNTSMALLNSPLLAGLYASITSACFALMSNVKQKQSILATALTGGLSWTSYLFLIYLGVPHMTAYTLSSCCAGLISEILALVLKEPATLFVIPALITFVPGGGMYATMYNVVLGNTAKATTSLLLTLSTAGAIALGIAFASGLARFLRKFVYRSLSA